MSWKVLSSVVVERLPVTVDLWRQTAESFGRGQLQLETHGLPGLIGWEECLWSDLFFCSVGYYNQFAMISPLSRSVLLACCMCIYVRVIKQGRGCLPESTQPQPQPRRCPRQSCLRLLWAGVCTVTCHIVCLSLMVYSSIMLLLLIGDTKGIQPVETCLNYSRIVFRDMLSSVVRHCWLDVRKSNCAVKIEWWGAGVVICLKRGTNDLHIVQLMPLPPLPSLASLKYRLV